jgi:hypothetical protein
MVTAKNIAAGHSSRLRRHSTNMYRASELLGLYGLKDGSRAINANKKKLYIIFYTLKIYQVEKRT